MLLQLHHQFDDHVELCSQREINSNKEYDEWIEETKKNYPLPINAQWMVCNEHSEYFLSTPVTK